MPKEREGIFTHPPTRELPPRVLKPRKKPRRVTDTVLAGVAASSMLLGGIETFNNTMTHALWQPRSNASIKEITPMTFVKQEGTFVIGKGNKNDLIHPLLSQPKKIKNIPPKRHAGTFVLGGLGTEDSSKYATAEFPALQKSGRVFAVVYPTDMSEPKIATAINKTIREDKLTEVNFDGVSTGGVVELRLLPYINTNVNGGVTINLLEFDDTPIIPFDIRDKNYRIPLWLYHKGMKEGGGFLGKLAGQIWTHTWSNPNPHNSLELQLKNAWKETVDTVSPALWIRQLDIDAQSTMEQTVRDLASVHYNGIIFMHPKILINDKTVKDKYAAQQLRWANKQAARIRHKAHKEGIPITSIPIPKFDEITFPGNVTHASAISHPRIYNIVLGSQLARTP